MVFAKDCKTGKGAAGVKMMLADGAKVIATGVTGADGVWHCRKEEMSEVGQLRVLGISERGMAGHALSIAGLSVPERLTGELAGEKVEFAQAVKVTRARLSQLVLAMELEIPFEKILQVGEAYRDLGEFERGVDVFLATIEAGSTRESFVGASLDEQGRFLDSVDFQRGACEGDWIR